MFSLNELKSPETIRLEIAKRFRTLRLAQNRTQEEIARFSGVSLGSIRRFERTGEISFKSLIALSNAVHRVDELDLLFVEHAQMDLYAPVRKPRQRARKTE